MIRGGVLYTARNPPFNCYVFGWTGVKCMLEIECATPKVSPPLLAPGRISMALAPRLRGVASYYFRMVAATKEPGR